MRALQTGEVIPLSCGHPHTVAFNDPHDTAARFFCGRCDGLRAPAPEAEFSPHDIRSWTPDDILLGVYAAAELWHSTSGSDPLDVLNDDQRELLDAGADVLAGEYYDVDPDRKADPFRAWSPRSLAFTLRAGGILWQSTGRDDPYDVLSTVQEGRLDRAALLVLTKEDAGRLSDDAPEPEPAPMGPGTAWQIVSDAIGDSPQDTELEQALNVLHDLAEKALNADESV
jgi:hypothetical protein